MAGRLLTQRRRRRLPWLAAAVILAAGLALLAVRYPNTARHEPAAVSNRPATTYLQPPSVQLTGARKVAAAAVARTFVVDAVLRVDPAAAWQLVTPSLRRGTVRADWRDGNIPVVPYERAALLRAKWRLWYAYADRVGFEVGLLPKPGAAERATKVTLELNEVGRGSHGHWLVSSWAPAPTLDPPPPGAKPGSPGLAAVSALPVPRGRLDARWLFIPLGLLVLAVVSPICIGTREWRRGVRAARASLRIRGVVAVLPPLEQNSAGRRRIDHWSRQQAALCCHPPHVFPR